MKSKSIQESLLQEILAFDDTSFPSFFHCDRSNLQNKIDLKANQLSTRRQNYQQAKPLACSMAELQDQILRMRVRATKMPSKTKNYNENLQVKKESKNIKTEKSQEDVVPPINYSTIYTRRSSLDQSLYDKALRQESSRKQWISRRKRQREESQLQQCSYKPIINQTSKQIMNRVDKSQIHQKLRKKKEESIKKIIEESQLKQMKECSFTPNIQKSQKKLVKSIRVQKFTIEQKDTRKHSERNSITIFDHLYEDYKTRKVKSKRTEEKYVKQISKKPSIDEISKQITKNTNFEERRLVYEKKRLQKQMDMRQKQNKSLRDSYRPSINSISHNRKKDISIGQYLYLQSKREPTPKAQPKINEPKVNKKSRQVYHQRKTLVFYQLFKLLDANDEGSISMNNINLECLPREVVKIIYPLIQELQVMDVQLQEHEFIHSIQNLFKSLTVHEKDILLGFIGGTEKQSNHQYFKPKINNKSRMIASCNQRSQMSIYQFCSIKQAERQKMLQQQRLEKSKRQLQGCTFQPKIIIKHRH